MNLINSEITAKSYSLDFSRFRTDPKFDIFQMGYAEQISVRLVELPFTKLTKPINKPFNDYNEIPSIKFDSYTDPQKINLFNLYNQTDISYPYPVTSLVTITGYITNNGQETSLAEVRLHDKLSGNILKKVWSDETGFFTIPDVYPDKEWYIVAFDEKGVMNSVILSGVIT